MWSLGYMPATILIPFHGLLPQKRSALLAGLGCERTVLKLGTPGHRRIPVLPQMLPWASPQSPEEIPIVQLSC